MQAFRRLYQWMGAKVYSPYAPFVLTSLFFLEAIFLPTADPLLLFFCLQRTDKAWRYAFIATIASVCGAIISYMIGLLLWRSMGTHIVYNPTLNYFVAPETLVHVTAEFKKHDWIMLLIGGITPIPYKAITLVAGFCQISLVSLIICSLLTRGFKCFMLASVMIIGGNHIKKLVDQHFNLLIALAITAAALLAWLLKK